MMKYTIPSRHSGVFSNENPRLARRHKKTPRGLGGATKN